MTTTPTTTREELFATVREDVPNPERAVRWLEAVIGDEVGAFDVESGQVISEEGVSVWHEVVVVTATQLLRWYVSAAEDEHLPEGTTSLALGRAVPLSRVTEVSMSTAHDADGAPTGVSVQVHLPSVDYTETADDEHWHVFHDLVVVSKNVQQDGADAVERVTALAHLLMRSVR